MWIIRCVVVFIATFIGWAGGPPASLGPGYILGPDDQITILAPDIEEISGKPFRIDMRGNVSLPMAGRIEAAGLTTDQLEARIKERFKRYLQRPDITVSIT